MTKEIIIDCIHKPKGSERCNAYSNNVFQWDCCEFDNCYYKQLKRLQTENKELKEYKTSKENSYQLLQKQWKDLFVQNRELKEEKQQAIKDWEEKKNLAYELACKNERLKEELAILQQENEDIAEARMEICNQCGNRDDYNIPCKMIRDLDYGLTVTIEERDNYKQALEEIRELFCVGRTFCEGYFDNDNLSRADKTIKIINEVLR